MSGGVDLARLGFAVDTAGLDRGTAAQDRMLASGVRLGTQADMLSQKLSGINAGGSDKINTAASNLSAAAQALQRAKAALPPDWEKMTQSGRTAWSFNEHVAGRDPLGDMAKARREMDALAAAQHGLSKGADEASEGLTGLGVAGGTLAGMFAFQLLNAVGSVVLEIGKIPMEAAEAQDSLLRLETQLKYAFQGSATAVRQARADIVALSRTSGIAYSDLSGQYASIATSGRAAGLTRSEVSGLTAAFSRLGQITGADAGQIGRAQYQLGQALAIGRLTGMDFRQMRSNLPGLNDALASGLNVDPGRLQGMVSRGEISVDRLLRGIIEGVDKIAGEAPRTMATARGRLQTEWELMLQDMGEAIQSSQMVQSFTNMLTDVIRGMREARPNGASPFDGPGNFSNFQRENPGVWNGGELPSDIDPDRTDGRSFARQAAVEAAQVRERQRTAADNLAEQLNSLGAQRAELNSQRTQFADALQLGGSPERIASWTQSINMIDAQLARLGTVLQQRMRQAGFADADLAQYGPGGFDFASQARGLAEQNALQGGSGAIGPALESIMREVLRGSGIRQALGAEDLARRQGLVDAAGGDVTARRRAQLDYEASNFASQFGTDANLTPAQREERDRQVGEFRRQSATRFAQDDSQTLQERERADNERLEALRQQLAMGIQLGQQGRIALAQAERERDLRRQFPGIAEDLINAEKDRLAIQIRLSEQLDLQAQQMGLLTDAAQTAGGAIGEALRHGIIEGARTGTLRAADFFNVLEDSALRVADRIMAAFLAPYENMAGDFLSNFLGNLGLPGLGGSSGNTATKGYASGVRNAPGGRAWVGENGPELMDVPVGANIYTAQQSRGMAAAGAPKMTVNIIDQRSGSESDDVQTQESTGPDGERMLDVIIRDKMKGNIASGAMDKPMQARYGANRQMRRR